MQDDATDEAEEVVETKLYEGLFASYKLLALNDKYLTYVLVSDMAGDHKISYLDNKHFNKINLTQSKKNSA